MNINNDNNYDADDDSNEKEDNNGDPVYSRPLHAPSRVPSVPLAAPLHRRIHLSPSVALSSHRPTFSEWDWLRIDVFKY